MMFMSIRFQQLTIFSRRNLYSLSRTSCNSFVSRPKTKCNHYHSHGINNRWQHQNVLVMKGPSPISASNNNSCSFLTRNIQIYKVSVSQFSTSTEPPNVPADLIFPDFPTIQAAENVIYGIHNITGLPWWATIISSAFLLRIALPLPLSIYSMHNSVRLQRLQPEIKETAQQLRKEVSMAMHQFGWDQKKAKTEFIKNMKRHSRNLYIRDNCHPMKDTASFWIRLPLWISASYALRNMSVRANNPLLENHENFQSLATDGIAWFSNLAVIDSTWILPVMMGMVTLLNVEIGRGYVSEMTTYRKGLTFALRGLSIVFIPISAYLPSGLVLYWVSSGFFSALQTVMVDRSSTFRHLIGIKQGPETSPDKDGSKSSSPK